MTKLPMRVLTGVRIKCDKCSIKSFVYTDGNQSYDPPGWQKRGSGVVCTECIKTLQLDLHPEVRLAAEKVVHLIQSLMATELSAQPPPGGSYLTVGGDGMARRMKRCELMAKYADVVMTIYGNEVGFRLATAGAFGFTSLIDIAKACEDLMKAEIAFSEARANNKPYKPTSNLAGTYSKLNVGSYDGYDSYEPQISGPLYRLAEISKVAHKLAQLAATRAGEVVQEHEDKIVQGALDGVSASPWGTPLHGSDTTSLYRQAMMLAQKFLENESDRRNKKEAEAEKTDPIAELEYLLDTKEKFEKAGRIDAAKALEIKIKLLESQIKLETEQTTVDSAIAAEVSSKDVTPKISKVEQFDGTFNAPPDDDEIEFLRKTIGDEAVKSGFPKEFEKVVAGEVITGDVEL